MPARRAAAVLGAVLGSLSGAGTPQARVWAQEAPGVAVAISPDSVLIGQPFTLGLSVRSASDEVRFPPLLPAHPALEQLEPVSLVRQGDGGEVWRAYYRLVPWSTGQVALAHLRIERGGTEILVTPPVLTVRSLLPPDSGQRLELRPPLPPVERGTIPWLLLLAALLGALLLYALMRRLRRREPEVTGPVVVDAGQEARDALASLRRAVADGRVSCAAFYDALEEIVRGYLHARRGWPVAYPVRALVQSPLSRAAAASWATQRVSLVPSVAVPEDAPLAPVQVRAGLARFAAVAGGRGRAVADASLCLAWLDESERARESGP